MAALAFDWIGSNEIESEMANDGEAVFGIVSSQPSNRPPVTCCRDRKASVFIERGEADGTKTRERILAGAYRRLEAKQADAGGILRSPWAKRQDLWPVKTKDRSGKLDVWEGLNPLKPGHGYDTASPHKILYDQFIARGVAESWRAPERCLASFSCPRLPAYIYLALPHTPPFLASPGLLLSPDYLPAPNGRLYL